MKEPGKCGEAIAVVYELTKRTQEKLFADWAQCTKHFLRPIRSRHRLEFLEIVRVKVGTQGLFRLYLKTFVPPFLLTRQTALGSPRMVSFRRQDSMDRRNGENRVGVGERQGSGACKHCFQHRIPARDMPYNWAILTANDTRTSSTLLRAHRNPPSPRIFTFVILTRERFFWK